MLNLTEIVNRKGGLDAVSMARLRALCERYPYYHAARVVYLRALHAAHDTGFSAELRRAALYVPSRETLYTLIEGDSLRPTGGAGFQPAAAEGTDRTDTLLNDFLSSLPQEKKSRRKPTVADAATDYIGYLEQIHALEREEQAAGASPALQHQDLIDVFLGTSGEGRIVLAERDEADMEHPNLAEPADDQRSNCTETLARIYIKQGKYDKAIDIIRRLSLKYPKKNRYFADQIRFLEKLIINNNNNK